MQAACDLLTAQVQLGFLIGAFPDAVAALRRETDQLGAALRAQADAVSAGRGALPVPDEPTSARRRVEIEVLEQWRDRGDDDVSTAVGVVWASEVLHTTDIAVQRAATAISAVAGDGS